MKRAISLILTLAMALTLAPAALGVYSDAYGTDVWLRDTDLHQDAVLSENILWSDYYNKPRRESFITFTPGQDLLAVASYGASVCDRTTTADAAAAYEAQGYRVVGAINGDFYDTATGYPLGLLVSDGQILSGSANYYALGFCRDGSAVMGQPGLTITAENEYGETLSLAAINKPRVENGGVTLLTPDFRTDSATGAATAGVSVLAEVRRGEAALGGSLELRVEEIIEGTDPVTMAEEQVVLTAAATANAQALSFLRTLAPGEELTVSFDVADPAWEEVTEAIGALHLLVENGVARADFKVDTAPRTAVGLTEDGEVILYTIDGRQAGHSMGASLNMLAKRMEELGCVTALCLDGGGSTTLMAATPDSETARLINSPSDRLQRKVSNHLLLLTEGRPTGRADHIYLASAAPAVLAGQTLEITANLVDTHYFPMDGEVELYASSGEMDGTTFLAPQEGGYVTITAEADDCTAELEVLVVDTPDQMTVQTMNAPVTTLTLIPGEKAEFSVDLTYNHLPLHAQPSDFLWAVDPALGTIDENGVLQTAFAEGSGSITVSKGAMTVTIPLTLDASTPFVDVDGHWGKGYMAALYRRGVFTGITVDEDLYAYPDKGVTRAEFSVLLARYLGLDLTEYAAVEVPFADMDKVDAWAADAVRAMYALGVVGGIETKDGKTIFDPQGVLTRSQAVTMLGRLRTEPVEPADLSVFTDAGDILPYALEHFQTMVTLEVIGGSYGKLDPNGTMTRAAVCKVLATLPQE